MYSTQHTHSLSTAFHTLLNILIAWVPLSILDSKYSKLEYRFPYSTRVWVRYEYGIGQILNDESSIEYDFPYSTQNTQSLSMTFHTRLKVLNTLLKFEYMSSFSWRHSAGHFVPRHCVWVRYRANTQRWVEYRVWLSILDSKYSKLEYNFPYSTQNTQSLSTTSHTRLNILIAWVQLSILYSSMSTVSGKILNDESSIEYDFPYSTQNTQSLSTTFHTRLKILKAWVQLSILDSKYSKLEYRFQYSTLNTLLDSTQPWKFLSLQPMFSAKPFDYLEGLNIGCRDKNSTWFWKGSPMESHRVNSIISGRSPPWHFTLTT